MRVFASILDCDLLRLGEEVERVELAGVDGLHLDVMDGHFVPNLSFGVPILEAVRRASPIPIESHLMVMDPLRLIPRFLAGSDRIIFHLEALPEPEPGIELVKAAGREVGLALNPSTPVDRVKPYLQLIDLVLLMSVNPGLGGQSFIPETFSRIEELRDQTPLLIIAVDGGVKPEMAQALKRAGVTEVIAGTGIFKAQDYKTPVAELRG